MLIFSPHVTSPGATDVRSVAAMLASPRLAGKRGQELAVAIWRLVLDKGEGLYHYCPAQERLTGHFVYDPVKLFNVFGWSICGVTANTLAVLYKDAGFADARIANLQGHEATEVFYDGGWHLLDGDLQAYHRRHAPERDVIASYADCLADPTLVSHQRNPSEPYYLPDRPAERMAELYRVEASTFPAFADHSHTMDFVLRPGETLERSADPQGRWIWFDNFTEFRRRFPGEWSDDGPRERFDPPRRYGNGRWVYEPDLTAAGLDFEAGAYEARNVAAGPEGLAPAGAGPAACTFEFDSPWAFAGTPAVDGRERPADGCIVAARIVQRGAGAPARVLLAVDPDRPWFEVWRSPGAGAHDVRLHLTEHVVNAYRYLLRFELGSGGPGSAALERLRVESAFMVAPASLGRLVEGANELTVRFGDEAHLATRRWLIETEFDDEAAVRAKTHRLVNARLLPASDDRILPADESRPYQVIYRVEAPPHGRVQRLFVHASVRGKADDDPTADRTLAEWAPDEDGPWRTIFDEPVPAVPHRWHVSAEGEAALDEPRRAVFVRLVGRAGLKTCRIRAHALDDRAGPAGPLEIAHEWTQADGTPGRHVERVDAPGLPHRYTVTCGPAPRLRRIVMRSPSLARPASTDGP